MSDTAPHRPADGRAGARHPGVLLATCGWIGYVPFAPGTAGSLVGLVCYGLVRLVGGDWTQLGLLVAVVVAGVWSSAAAERHFGRTDPGAIVIDEVAGMLLTLLWLPVTWAGVIAAFVLFRLFDIVKPFPVRRTERLGGGWGVMADDLAAGVYAHVALLLLAWALPGLTVS
ncbi:MAG: phosphatidylglycerophosphatase A [Acidobacteria bacterium]|nr:phosphatidylglycerophosphatase A [Acidobacteriota bacterium]